VASTRASDAASAARGSAGAVRAGRRGRHERVAGAREVAGAPGLVPRSGERPGLDGGPPPDRRRAGERLVGLAERRDAVRRRRERSRDGQVEPRRRVGVVVLQHPRPRRGRLARAPRDEQELGREARVRRRVTGSGRAAGEHRERLVHVALEPEGVREGEHRAGLVRGGRGARGPRRRGAVVHQREGAVGAPQRGVEGGGPRARLGGGRRAADLAEHEAAQQLRVGVVGGERAGAVEQHESRRRVAALVLRPRGEYVERRRRRRAGSHAGAGGGHGVERGLGAPGGQLGAGALGGRRRA
jgi:hypothetical protein